MQAAFLQEAGRGRLRRVFFERHFVAPFGDFGVIAAD
jgi:hypothetical protein